MKVYTVHYRLGGTSDDDVVLVKEGFSWPALFFNALWALYHRMWLVAALILIAGIVLDGALALAGADPTSAFAATFALSLFVAFEANDWRRRSLARRGWREGGIVAAADRDAALRRYFDLHPDGPAAAG